MDTVTETGTATTLTVAGNRIGTASSGRIGIAGAPFFYSMCLSPVRK